jgi:hypothetical protein
MSDPVSGLSPDSSAAAGALANDIGVYIQKAALELHAKPIGGLYDNLTEEQFPMYSGEIAYFHRNPQLPIVTSGLTRGENPTPNNLDSAKLQASLNYYGGYVAVEELARIITVNGLEEVPKLINLQAWESLEYWAALNIAAYCKLINPDGSATYQQDILTTSAGSTTLVNSTNLVGANDFWTGGSIVIDDRESPLDGQVQYVTDDDSGAHAHTGAFTEAVGDSTKFHIATPAGITSSKKLTLTALRYAQMFLMISGCDGPNWWINGGYLACPGPGPYNDLIGDTDVKNMFIYSEPEGIHGHYAGRLAAISFSPTSSRCELRTAISGAASYSEVGAVHYVPVFGKNAIKKMPLEHQEYDVIVKTKAEIGGPLEMFETIGWKHKWAGKVVDANGAISIMCGSSAP